MKKRKNSKSVPREPQPSIEILRAIRNEETDAISLLDAQIEEDIRGLVDILIKFFVCHLLIAEVKEDFARILFALCFYQFPEIHDTPLCDRVPDLKTSREFIPRLPIEGFRSVFDVPAAAPGPAPHAL
jgi:hypothetical protein